MPRLPLHVPTPHAALRAGLLALLGAGFLLACGGSDGDGIRTPARSERPLVLSASGQFDDVAVSAAAGARFTFTGTQVPPAGPFDGLELDVEDTLAMISISPPPVPARAIAVQGAPLTGTADVIVRVGLASEEATVCDEGREYGPITLPLDGGPVLAGAEDVVVDPASVQTINRGAYSVCVEVLPTENAVFSIGGVAFDATDCDESVGSVTGVWTGTYRCTDSCGEDFGGTVRVEIEQDGISATYMDDLGGNFKGTVCGSQLRYSGGYSCGEGGNSELVCEEVESGIFARTGESTAVKNSRYTYFSLGGLPCSGTCSDSLRRVVEE